MDKYLERMKNKRITSDGKKNGKKVKDGKIKKNIVGKKRFDLLSYFCAHIWLYSQHLFE